MKKADPYLLYGALIEALIELGQKDIEIENKNAEIDRLRMLSV